MKSAPAVFITSLAVSAISLITPLPAASTILNLFIGEEIAMEDVATTKCEDSQQPPTGEKDSKNKDLPNGIPEQQDFAQANYKAAVSLISNVVAVCEKGKRIVDIVKVDPVAGNKSTKSLFLR